MARPDTKTRISGWTYVVWFVLAAAVILPVFLDKGWIGHVASWGAGLLVVGALAAASRRSGLEQPERLSSLKVASLIFPTVDRYRKQLEDRQQVITDNEAIIANMKRMVEDYDLAFGDPGLEEQVVDHLDTLAGSGFDPKKLSVERCVDEAVDLLMAASESASGGIDTLFDPEWNADRRSTLLSEALQVLFCTDAGADVRQRSVWDKEKADRSHLIAVLSRVVRRHEKLSSLDGTPRFSETAIAPAIEHLSPKVGLIGIVEYLRETPAAVVEHMSAAMRFYGLGGISERDRSAIVASLAKIPASDLPAACASRVAELEGRHSSALLELLYRERVGRDTGTVWQGNLSFLVEEVAPILAASGAVGRLGGGAGKAELELVLVHVLPDFEVFDHRAVAGVIKRVAANWQDLSGYAAMLRNVGIRAHPAITDLLDRLPNPVSDPSMHWDDLLGPETSAEVLIHCGTGWFATEGRPTDEARALAIVTSGLFAAAGDKGFAAMGAAVARRAARPATIDGVTKLLLGVLWYAEAEDVGVETLDYGTIASEGKAWSRLAHDEFGDTVSARLRTIMRAELMLGRWPLALPTEAMLSGIVMESRRLWEAVQVLEGSAPASAAADEAAAALRETVENLLSREDAIPYEGLVDRSRVYVITFDGRSGPLAELIDCLRQPVSAKYEPGWKEILREFEVDPGLYDFVHYTRYARIGHIPPMTFAEFHERFHHDLDVVLRWRRWMMPEFDFDEHELTEMEVTMQQIVSATRHNYSTSIFEGVAPPSGRRWFRPRSIVKEGFGSLYHGPAAAADAEAARVGT